MRVDNSIGKGTSGMDKFSSKVHRVHMELGSNLLNSLRNKTQFLPDKGKLPVLTIFLFINYPLFKYFGRSLVIFKSVTRRTLRALPSTFFSVCHCAYVTVLTLLSAILISRHTLEH